MRRDVKNAIHSNAMRIACPNCQTLYDVPDNLLGNGPRRLRCDQCGHGWAVAPDDETKQIEKTPEPEMSEALTRRFGEPSDAAAKAEIQAALRDEAQGGHEEEAPEPHASEPPAPELHANESDRFADLVRAARNNEVEREPEKARLPKVSAANSRLITPLLILLLLALIVVERHAVMKLIPASAKLFHALHLA